MTLSSIPTIQPAARALLGQAVLFDCDGVLVDSDPSVVTAWSRWATEFGLVPAEVVAVVHGRRAVDTVAALLAADRHAEALALINRYEIEDASTVRPIPGADQLLRSLPTGTWAVVTSALSGLARGRISASGLPTPTHLITADLVTRGKPDPEGYLLAAQRLDMRPGDCIVIEDAVEGVAAARAAGVATVVGVGERVTHAPIDFHVPDLTALTWTDDGLTVRTSHPAPNNEPGD